MNLRGTAARSRSAVAAGGRAKGSDIVRRSSGCRLMREPIGTVVVNIVSQRARPLPYRQAHPLIGATRRRFYLALGRRRAEAAGPLVHRMSRHDVSRAGDGGSSAGHLAFDQQLPHKAALHLPVCPVIDPAPSA
jgi:hypothetical protein